MHFLDSTHQRDSKLKAHWDIKYNLCHMESMAGKACAKVCPRQNREVPDQTSFWIFWE